MNANAHSVRSGAPRRWTGLLGKGLSFKLAQRARRLSDTGYWAQDTARLQAQQLRGLIAQAQKTEFGKAHDFARIVAISDDAEFVKAYQAVVPLADWYAFKDPLERMRLEGQPDVLWPGLVGDFCQTSGTTAGDKFIPVSKEMLRSNYNAAMDIFANLTLRDISVSRIFSGKSLFLGGSSAVSANEHGVRTGDLSGLVTGLIKWPLTEIYSPGPEIALMDDWPKKIDAMAELAIDQDIRMINGMPSWGHVLMARVIELAKERGRDVSCVRDVWPNLDLFVHGGVRYTPFQARMREVYSGSPTGDDFPHRLELYPASEGFLALQDGDWDSTADGRTAPLRLNTDIGLFYEFVPLESIDDENAPAFTCDQVEPGVRYVVVMSTCAGLWRYILGDVVEFESCPDGLNGRAGWSAGNGQGDSPSRGEAGPARLRIVGRHRHFINAFGENLIVEHIETAVAQAAETARVVIGEFTAAPVYPVGNQPAGLELAVEVEPAGWPDARLSFAEAFDQALKAQNVDYTTKRGSDLGMAPPTITALKPGAFHRWLDSRGKLGGQHKCPRCANNREILDAVVGVDQSSG